MLIINQIFFLPPMAVARLGGSDKPLDSFTWIEDPTIHGAGKTVITPTPSLRVQEDGSVRPFLPNAIQFRDGSLLRPTAPFFELWAQLDGKPDAVPLTADVLAQSSGSLNGVTFTVVASNRKAARRTGDSSCAFTARIQVAGTDHSIHPLLASSAGDSPLVLPNQPISVGQFQVIRPTVGLALNVDLSVLRVRFTPARGEVYGPPSATQADEPDFPNLQRRYELVPLANRILNPNSSWLRYTADDRGFNNPEPADTYDGADDNSRNNQSYGVVDDTCDAVIQAEVVVGGNRLRATARVFSGPPDFAPDHRPFVSLADELIDRDPPVTEPVERPIDALDRLADLFQRVYEAASLANVDAMRERAIGGGQDGGTRNDRPRTNDQSMTPQDQPYYRRDQPDIEPPNSEQRLPYAATAQDRHAPLADAEDLALFLRDNAELVRKLIRPPFGAFKDLAANPAAGATPNPAHRDARITRDTLHDMRMPPYMRDSDATALSLTRRQYELLMEMVNQFAAAAQPQAAISKGKAPTPPAAPLPTKANDHVSRVVTRREGRKP